MIGGIPYRPAGNLPSADEMDAFRASGIKVHPVKLSAKERVVPELHVKRVQQLQELCIAKEIAYSGLNKDGLRERLAKFYAGQAVPKRGSAKDLGRMACLEDEPVGTKPVPESPQSQAPVLPKSSARARAAQIIEQMRQERQMRDSCRIYTEDDMFMEGIPSTTSAVSTVRPQWSAEPIERMVENSWVHQFFTQGLQVHDHILRGNMTFSFLTGRSS